MGQDDQTERLEPVAYACPACRSIVGRLRRRVLDVDAGEPAEGAVYECAGCGRPVRITAPRRPPPRSGGGGATPAANPGRAPTAYDPHPPPDDDER